MEDIYSYSNGKKPKDWKKECLKTPKHKKAPPGKGKRVLAFFLAVVILIAGAGGVFVFSKLGKIRKLDLDVRSGRWIAQDSLHQDKEITNIMLVGLDRRTPDEVCRSDTMILLSIDRKHRKLKLTSFLRDIWLTIPGEGEERLNAANAFGGPELLLDTIETNFHIRVDKVVVIDFEAFQKAIDTLGGVELEVSKKESQWLYDHHWVKVPAGTSTLNGEQALWYCRIRKIDSDFGRTQRQRKLLAALAESGRNAGPLKLNSTLDQVLPLVDTNLSDFEIIRLGLGYLTQYRQYDVEQCSIPAEGTWWDKKVNKAQVLGINFEKNRKLLYEFIYLDQTPENVKNP